MRLGKTRLRLRELRGRVGAQTGPAGGHAAPASRLYRTGSANRSLRAPASLSVKNILVVGYPKSGCTWATRLVAELVGCPVAGFWRSGKKEIATEGADRPSDFRCYKSHHQYSELGLDPNDGETRVVYILRDPRDIALSAASYFTFYRRAASRRFFERHGRLRKLYLHTLYPLFAGRNYRLARMTDALLHGDATVHDWCRVSWLEHFRPYRDAAAPVVRYEDLLDRPHEEAAKILRHLGLERPDAAIASAVANQSFANRKQAFLQAGEKGQAKFLRVGKSGQWRDGLPRALQARFTAGLRDELAACGYAES